MIPNIPTMPIALIVIATILSIEIISRRYNKNSLAKHQKRQEFDKMMASADNEQARADVEMRRRKMEDKQARKGKAKEEKSIKGSGDAKTPKRKLERVRGRLAGGRMRRGSKKIGSDGYEVVDVTRDWEERYKTEMDSWDFGGSGEW